MKKMVEIENKTVHDSTVQRPLKLNNILVVFKSFKQSEKKGKHQNINEF